MFVSSSILELAGIGLIGPYVKLLLNPGYIVESPIGEFFKKFGLSVEPISFIIIIGLGLIGIFFFKAIATIYINWKILQFMVNREVKLRTELMESYQQLSYLDYLNRNSSAYIQVIHGMVGQYIYGVLRPVLQILCSSIITISIVAFLVFTNVIALILLLTIVGIIFFIYDRIFKNKLKVYGEKLHLHGEKIFKYIREAFNGFKEIRILGKSDYFLNSMKKHTFLHAQYSAKATIITAIPMTVMEFIIIVFIVSFISLATFFGENIKDIIPVLSVFAIASIRLKPLLSIIIQSFAQLRFGQKATNQLYKDLRKFDLNDDIKIKKLTIQPKSEPFISLKLNDLSFRYPNTTEWALKDLNISIEAGESIGLIGPSGSGKTTLVDVFLGLLVPQQGDIQYNNCDLNQALSDWQSQVVYIPQDVFLTDNSLRANVAIGLDESNINDIKLYEALRQAHLSDLVKQLPEGVSSLLGERGVRLSGGQGQRVALARSFYYGRNVLVLDEATSSLDHETEGKIVEEIKHLKGKKTLIVIAHRLTTVEHCDRIYRMEEGHIVEQGSYDEVVNSKMKTGA